MSEEQLDLLEWLAAQRTVSPEIRPSTDVAPAEAGVTPVRLTRTDPACNMHRFYSLELATSLFGEWGVGRHWGRIGTAGRIRTDWYDDPHVAAGAFQNLLRAKQKWGYAPKGGGPSGHACEENLLTKIG